MKKFILKSSELKMLSSKTESLKSAFETFFTEGEPLALIRYPSHLSGFLTINSTNYNLTCMYKEGYKKALSEGFIESSFTLENLNFNDGVLIGVKNPNLKLSHQAILNAVITKLNETDFRGDKEESTLSMAHKKQKMSADDLGGIYAKKEVIPIVVMGLRELQRLTNISNPEDAKRELLNLSNIVYFMCWKRLARDKEGNPILRKDGSGYEKELVQSVEPLITVRHISTEEGRLKQLEIQPAPILFDEADSFYNYLPENWLNDFRKAMGRKSNQLIGPFAIALSRDFQTKKQARLKGKTGKASTKNALKKPIYLEWSYDTLFERLAIPEKEVKKKRGVILKKMMLLLETAKKQSYLEDFSLSSDKLSLTLNNAMFHPLV